MGTTAPFNTVRVNIFSSDPSVAGAISVYGDDTTNRFSAGTDSNMYRTGNSQVPTATTPGTARKIWKITASTPKTLGPGTYNAKQFDAILGTWAPIVDTGNPVTAPDYPLDMPFVITFTSTTLGTNETMQYDNRIQVYPNPVKDNFRINNPEKIKISTIEIMDASGKLVKTLKGSEDYNASDLPKGNYILKINNDSVHTKITKLIKQ